MFLASFSPVVQSTSAPSFAPDDEGQVVAGYTLGPIIARGGFSVIRRASSAAGGTVAVKIVRRSEISKQPDAALVRKKLEREAETWASLSHEHILPLFASSHTAFADFFVMPYCPAGTLFDILSREGRPGLPPDDAGMLFRQVVRGLRYLHETAEIVHRDMKLENVLVDESGICRIADFGMARRIGEAGEDEEDVIASSQSMSLPAATAAAASTLLRRKSTLAPRALRERMQQHARRKASNPLPSSAVPQAHQAYESGSLPYAAPELLIPHERALPADPAQDIWALGVMLYALLVGRLPFMDSFEPRLQMKILHGTWTAANGTRTAIGAEAERVIDGCLERDVDERWTIAMVDDVAWGVGW
ncbi:kinase-like protein, partial [Punctularia strigosozonata HHB-11173 SS5]|uniref:kinase-like protein n=1 Tax=Punctularia strigosozonata (strain HHB-11173) TaxID=741275 RepID=UPI00044173B8